MVQNKTSLRPKVIACTLFIINIHLVVCYRRASWNFWYIISKYRYLKLKGNISNNFWTLSLCYIPFFLKLFARFSSRLLRARWRGPSAKKYVSVIWPPAARFPRPLEGHFCTHWESGSVALHTVTWQWTNTNGWPAINLKASRLNRWALTDGEEWYCTVTSLGHLKYSFEEYKLSIFRRR